MNNNRILLLLTKYQANACSEQELQELEQWYIQLNSGNESIKDSNAVFFSAEMLLEFKKRFINKAIVIPFYRRHNFRVAVAASILILLSAGVYLKLFNTVKQNSIVKFIPPQQHDVAAPKISKATITLSNGQTILLNSINTGALIKQSGVDIVKTADGQITYKGNSTALIYNTIFNPKGSKALSIILNDGTKVWLNSESSLRYPVAFAGTDRKVEINGEAYFEVAKDPAKKFIVTSNQVNTEVLGTHFNVNTYSNENSVVVTLLEGKVKVTKGTITGMLKPGQQAEINAVLKINDNIDTEAVVAWKNGFFHFSNTSMQNLMKQIARWYDIDIVYKNKIPQREFGGEISREANLSEILKILIESKIKCSLEGRKLMIE